MLAPTLTASERILEVLGQHAPKTIARSILSVALRRLGQREDALSRDGLTPALLTELESGLKMFITSPEARSECARGLAKLTPGRSQPLQQATITIRDEDDVVDARSQARLLASDLGFDPTTQIKIATAVSELARNIQRYAGNGFVLLHPQMAPRKGLRIVARDTGPGIPHLKDVLAGTYKSKTGMGLGLRGCRQLMDEFHVQTAPGLGTTVRAAKWL